MSQTDADPTRAASTDHALLARMLSEPVERHVLDNGLVALLKPDHAADLVSAQVWVRTGSIHEGPLAGSGLSHYLEHMLFKGTDRRDYRQISAEVHGLGGHVNAYTSFDRTVYYIDAPAHALDAVLDILSDIVLDSRVDADEATRERDVILREIDMGLDDPDRRLAYGLFATAFREHPYRYPVIGRRSHFEQVTPAQLSEYYRARYRPDNLCIILAGAFEPDEALTTVQRHFGRASGGPLAPVYVPEEPPQLSRRDHREYGGVTIVRGGMAFRIPGLRHPDSPSLDLLASALGHGASSILWQRLREQRGLVHHIDALCWNPGPQGLFWINYICDRDKREATEAAIEEELGRVLGEGLPTENLEKARRQALVGEVNGRKTMAGQAARLGMAEVVVGDLGYPAVYFERLARVTPGAVRSALETYLLPAACTRISLEPEKASVRNGARPAKASAQPLEEVRLDNGARLLLLPSRRLPKVHLRLAGLGGPLYEPPGQRGVNALMTTLLTRDAGGRSASEVAERVEGLGGAFTDFCGNNSFGLALEGLSNDLGVLADLLGKAIHEPAWHPDTFERERRSQVAEIQEEDDDIVDYGRRLLRERFFGEHPLAIAPLGRQEDLEALGPEATAAMAARLLRPENCVLSVCGDFERSAILDTLGPILERLPDGGWEAAGARFEGPAQTGRVEEMLPRQQAVVFLGFPDCGVGGDAFHAAEVADELLSGMSSQLFMRVREEKGMAYFVGASRIQGLDTGIFFLNAGTHPGTVEAVLAEMEGELERLRQGAIEPGELRRCQVRLKAQKRMSLQSPGARAMHAALNALYGLPQDDGAAYDAKIDAVTVEAVADFARSFLAPENGLTLVVRPEGGAQA